MNRCVCVCVRVGVCSCLLFGEIVDAITNNKCNKPARCAPLSVCDLSTLSNAARGARHPRPGPRAGPHPRARGRAHPRTPQHRARTARARSAPRRGASPITRHFTASLVAREDYYFLAS